jgi:Lamin Tail Domain
LSKIAKSILVASLLIAGIVVSPSFQSPASAAYCIGIYRIYYNSPGTDTGSNTSLDAEWIQLHNRCSTSRSLTNAKIKDAAGHSYTFGSYTLGGGKYVKVHTGKGTDTATHRYQGRSWYVWNNDKDTAYLYNASGTRLDSCSYNNRSASSVYC